MTTGQQNDTREPAATAEERLRVVIDTSPGLVWSAAPDGSIDFLNQRWIDYTGLPLDQIRETGWFTPGLVHPDDVSGLTDTWKSALASGQPAEAEARLRRFDGRYRWFLLRAVPLHGEQGDLGGWCGANTDIEDRKQTEALLAGENRLLEMLAQGLPLDPILEALCRMVEARFEGSFVSILLLDPEDNRLWYGAAGSLPAGYTEALDGIAIGPAEGSCGTAAYRNEPVIAADIATDPRWTRYREVAAAHGLRACWSTPIRSSGGSVLGTFAILSREPGEPTGDHQRVIAQMTHLASVAIERTRTENALADSEERFRRLADSIPEVIWIMALEPEKVLYASPSFERIWARSVEDLYRNPRLWTDAIHADDRERVTGTFGRWIAGEDVDYHDVEFRIVRPDGEIRWIHERGVLILDGRGKPCRASGISTDITERKRSEEELRRSEAYLAEAQRLSQTGSLSWDVSGRALAWSTETFRIFGCDPATTRPSMELVFQRTHPDDLAAVKEAVEHCSREGHGLEFEHRLVMPSGSIKHVRVVARANRNAAGGLEYVGSVMDVTAARQALQEIQTLKDQLHKENIALRDEVDKTSMFEEIVGSSEALRRVLSELGKVAPTNSTVLITGETGTGKELIARAIHKRSARARRAFVAVNCAAIPASLVAAELFGHEKGAFTGATQRRLGRFELADGGTIFLDEIGDLPPETQATLLRVIQEGEFEPVGRSRPIAVDVRILAATNQDLRAAVGAGTFRQDLFYRLSVFPIAMPSLHERAEDIPLLVEYFVERYARKTGKRISRIEKRTLQLLQAYRWPGNIRELQNVIERAVILSDGETFRIDESWLGGEARERIVRERAR